MWFLSVNWNFPSFERAGSGHVFYISWSGLKKKKKNESPRLWEPCNSHGLDRVQSQEQPLMNHILLKKWQLPWLDLLKVFLSSCFNNAFGLNGHLTNVQEHCSLPDIFKFQVRISGSLPWKVGCWTLGPFPLGCASFYIIAKLTTRQPPGRVGQGFSGSLWNWKPLLPLIISAPQKWIVKWFHKFVQRDEQRTFERVFSLWLQTEFLFLSSVSTTPAILACAV